jgi:hypothetical protein
MISGPPRTHFWFVDVWFYACAYSLALLALDVWTGFHIGINDFWGAYYQAENLDFGDPQTLYDGFFPIGYPFLLRMAPGDDFIEAGYAIAVACRIFLVGAFGTLALRFMSGAWALTAAVAFSLIPRIFENVLTPGSDLPMMALALAGGACLLQAVVPEGPRPRRWALLLAGGALLGLSGLFRQHGLVLAAGMLLGAAAVRPREVGRIFIAGLVCGLAYSPQMVVNLLAHRGPLETFQYVNIYKMVHGVELRAIPLDLSPDLRGIIAADPSAFFVEWSRHFFLMFPVLVPAFLSALYLRDAVLRRSGVLIAIAGVPYLAAVSLGWSTRAVLPLIPWAVLLAACLAQRAQAYAARRIGIRVALGAVMGVAMLLLMVWASRQNARLVRHYLNDHHYYSEIERALTEDGVVHPKQLYTTDGSLYFPDTPPHWPYFDGTWGLFSLYKYAERFPRLNVGTLADFRDECDRQGITHVALDGNAGAVSPSLGDLYQHPKAHAEFDYLGHVGAYALFRRRDV